MCGALQSKYRSDYGGECPVAANDTALCSGYSYHLEFHVRVILKATLDRFAKKEVLFLILFLLKDEESGLRSVTVEAAGSRDRLPRPGMSGKYISRDLFFKKLFLQFFTSTQIFLSGRRNK